MADTQDSYNLSIAVGFQSMQKVSFVLWRQIPKRIFECNFPRGLPALRDVNVITIKTGIRVVRTGKQRAQCVNDRGLSDVVWADQDIQSWYEL